MKTILVTGGAGYIGSHVCKELSKASYVPVTYDNLVNGHESLVKWGPLEKGDLIDSHRINGVFNRYNPDAVMHLAALTDVGESVLDPWKYYYNNVTGSIYLFEAMRRYKINKIVYCLQFAVYCSLD